MISVKTTTAAILVNSKNPLIVDEIELPSILGAGQVLVEVITSGICGAQINEIDAVKGPDKFLPHLLGHEGFARVVEIGPGVITVSPNDFVVMHWRPGSGIQSAPAEYKWRGQRLNSGWVTTFNKHSVVSENRVTKVFPAEHDRNVLPLLGCALTTALGVLEKDAKANFRDSLLIFGGGGVGLALIKIAKLFGIKRITVVDVGEKKLKYATNLGASNVVQFSNKAETLNRLKPIFGEELPTIAVDTTGNIEAIELCYEIISPTGRAILVGVPSVGSHAKIHTLPLHFGKMLKGSHGGDSMPQTDIPILLDYISNGILDFADYPIHKFGLKDVNEAISNLRNGTVGRMIIDCQI